MTHPNFQTNGASLEDCHTNFFALMDLCGIKWRRLSADNLYCVDPLDDPVLLAFTKCLAADILCVWRRVPHQRTHLEQHRYLQELNAPPPLLYKKELWIFWYGNEPTDLNNILCSELSEVEQGPLDTGLNYECRTLLFKAIHNRIERSLLSKDYVRLGKWFVQPYDATDKPCKSPHSLAFSFFIHGDSTVCACVDVREPPPVRRLTPQHIITAQGTQPGVQVILGPYGQSGVLTGQVFKDGDHSIQKLLEEWRQFYPVDSKLGAFGNREGSCENSQMPAFVEVIVAGVKLKYPSCYVLVSDMDEPIANAIQPTTLLAMPSPQVGSKASGTTAGTTVAVSSVSLTPPTSPCDPTTVTASTTAKSSGGITVGNTAYSMQTQLLSTTEGSCSQMWDKISRRLVSHVTQDGTILSASARAAAAATSGEEAGGNWDFVDPVQKALCSCSKCKKGRLGPNNNKQGSGTNSTTNVISASGKKGDKSEKADKQQPRHLRSTTPFHRRPPTIEDAVVFNSDAVSRQTNASGSGFQFKGTNSCSGTLGGLPQLRTNTQDPPMSVGSPVSAAPSPLMPLHSQPASVSQPDPTMPTLSPHPLASKDPGITSAEEQANPESHAASIDSSGQAPQTPQDFKEGPKSAAEQPQVFSPFPNQNSVGTPKPPDATNWSQIQAPPSNQSQCAGQVQKPCQQIQQPPTSEPQPPPLKRPVLPTSNYEELEDDEPTTEALYDYSSLNAWLQHPVKRFKPDPRQDMLLRSARGSVGDNLPSPITPSFKKEPLTPQMQLDMDMASPKQADPYEFVDDFPTTVSMAGFKSKNETNKEDEKPRDPNQPNAAPADAAAQAVPPKDNKTGVNGETIDSPLTPKALCPAASLFREKDLVATYEDLDQLFDTTSDDDTTDNAAPCSPGSMKAIGTMGEDGTPGKNSTKVTGGIGILGTTELLRMFPTPPSLEQASPSGVVGMGDLAVMEGGDTAYISNRERSDIYPGYGSPSEEFTMDWSYVFKPPPVSKFVGSSKYAPLANLPSQTLPPLSLPPQCIYKPSWQYPMPVMDKPMPVSHISALSSVESMDRMHGSVGRSMEPSPATFVSSVEPRMPHSFELQSPASNASSYLNKNLNSIDDGGGANHPSHMPEAHSLVVNLMLSDSLLNLFKDHNFNSCTMCVCNMNIKGSDIGLYLPDVTNLSDEPTCRCSCGFSAVVNRKYGFHSGLFYEDELEITGLRNEALDRRKSNLLVIGQSSELALISPASSSALKDALDPLPAYLLELLKVQYTTLASSTCNLFYKTALSYHQLVQRGPPPLPPPPPPPPSNAPTIASAASIMATISAVAAGCLTTSSAPSVTQRSLTPPPPPCLVPVALDASTTASRLEMMDGCEVMFSALDQGRQAYENSICLKLDENLKSTVVHKWPFLPAKLPSNNQDLVRLLRTLQPLLQEAIHKKQSTQFWEATTTATYTVSGPLTWRQFLKLAGRKDQCEPQPIPSLLVGYDKDWLALSPFTIKYWEKLLLEPYSLARDIAYIVVAPDNDYILGNVKKFFKELSGAYEVCRLGRHSPITKVLRDGIMRVGKKAAKNLANEPVDEWFNLIGDSPIASKLKLYAQVCRHHLAPHLATQPMDSTLLDSPMSCKASEKMVPAASPMPPLTPENQDKDRVPTPKPMDTSVDGVDGANQSLNKDSSVSGGLGGCQDMMEQDDERQAPSLVIYMVDPFSYCSDNPDQIRLSTLGLLRCYSQMLRFLPEHMQNNINLQIIPLESILEQTTEEERCKQTDRLKSLAFSVFAQCRRTLVHQSTVKSLTGFGPAAAGEMFLKAKDGKNSAPYRMYSPPYILAPMKDKQTQLTESFGDHTEKATVLFCTYCLSEDQRWLLATCTDDRGEILETRIINVEIPNRHRRKKASARKIGLQKLMDWLLGIMSSAVMPWRLVVGKLGRLGHGELSGWSNLLSRKTLVRYSKHLKEMCKQCQYMSVQDTPCILSACLVSLESDSILRVMPDQFTADEFFSCNSCDLSTPQDASCTHILVFPTSATTQAAQNTFQQDPIDALGPNFQEVDILSALDEEGHNMTDISAIFDWTNVQSSVDSPHRESNSRTGSPDLGINDRQSPFANGGFSMGGNDIMGDPQEEAPQLLQQPLALGYYVSTAKTGPLPKWFWAPCPHLDNVCPAFLKSALHVHSPAVQQSSDDLFQQQTHLHNYHPLDSNLTTDVLRFVLEGYNALSWLSVDPVTHDRRSCLPVHIQVLMQMYYAMATLV